LESPFQDRTFMQKALEEAQVARRQEEIPVGAIIVCRGRIIARAHNMTETLNDPTAHAEMQAITSACYTLGGKYLDQCTLYVTLEPCPMCAGALAWAQLGRLVYAASDPKRGFTLVPGSLLHPKTKVTPGVLSAEAGELIKDFFAGKR